ncbi:MAG TPA: orotidine-5'-phosphate decarboxylase [Sphingobacteriaceae bacterium]|nr:orotidine-5'-phosphate decarboxylase [Sphingobacteriaceae bacterium]
MNRAQLISAIKNKASFLCVGLDTDITKIPSFLLDYEDPIFEFNKQIIEATEDLCVAYKPNTAFYESRGVDGWKSLQKTWAKIPKNCLSIADAKRGDIGNTSKMYAKAFFDQETSGMSFDALTVAPYMGSDSVSPFLDFKDKWTIVLALTSNQGGLDFQLSEEKHSGLPLYQQVISRCNEWGTADQLMYVVGATRAERFTEIRKWAPHHFLLVPGVGAQGGSLKEVCQYGWVHQDVGLLINATRSLIYASNDRDFAEKARAEALLLQKEMEQILIEKEVI